MSDPHDAGAARRRMLRGARFALHIITAVLTVVTAIRAASTGDLLVVSLAAAAFLGWYGAGASFAHRRIAMVWVVVLALIWGGMLVLSPEFLWLAFPLLLLAGHVLRAPWSFVFAGLILAASVAAPFLHPGWVPAGASLAHIVGPLVGGGFAFAVSLGYDALLRDAAERERLISSLLRAQEEAERLHDELVTSQREAGAERERTRLARDLHDTIAQELSSIVILARAQAEASAGPGAGGPADADAPDDAARARGAAQIEELARHSLVELRRIVAALAPAELEGSALAAALGRMLDGLAAEGGVETVLTVDPDLPALSTPAEVALLRVAQSALANVRQHSAARLVRVELTADAESARLSIADDGVGFEPAARPSEASYGLAAMRSRLHELGGALGVDAAPGAGARITATVPRGTGDR